MWDSIECGMSDECDVCNFAIPGVVCINVCFVIVTLGGGFLSVVQMFLPNLTAFFPSCLSGFGWICLASLCLGDLVVVGCVL